MDLKIGLKQSPQAVEISLEEKTKIADIQKQINEAVTSSAMLWLEDKDGNSVAIAGSDISFVEIKAGDKERKIGFGA